MFKRTIARGGQSRWRATIPQGVRVYAIGDVHGQTALLDCLLKRIWADCRARLQANVHLVFIGDLIDRGPGAADLVTRFARRPRSEKLVTLLGNHEWAMVNAYLGDEDMAKWSFEFGGAETLAGFGVAVADIDPSDGAAIVHAIQRAVPRDVFEWMARLPVSHKIGDYLFVHAGVRPGVAFEKQSHGDVLWISEPFLSSRKDHGHVIVHGHSIETGNALARGNRIGIDSGAYKTGVLTAVGLEGGERWLITAEASLSRVGTAQAAAVGLHPGRIAMSPLGDAPFYPKELAIATAMP